MTETPSTLNSFSPSSSMDALLLQHSFLLDINTSSQQMTSNNNNTSGSCYADLLPCEFTVLQGMPPDQLANTIDTHTYNNNNNNGNNILSRKPKGGQMAQSSASSSSSSSLKEAADEFVVVNDQLSSSVVSVDAGSEEQKLNDDRSKTDDDVARHHNTTQQKSQNDDTTYSPHPLQPYRDVHTKELLVYDEIPSLFVVQPTTHGRFEYIPPRKRKKNVTHNPIIASLAPGSRVVCLAIHDAVCDPSVLETYKQQQHTLDQQQHMTSSLLLNNIINNDLLSILKVNICSFLQVELDDGRKGYVYCSFDHYKFLVPHVGIFKSELEWVWRVVYKSGAVVREGLELSSRQLDIVPFGCFVTVVQKTINQTGLSRLKLRDSQGKDCGWISEKLNPRSGQSGFIVQPLPPSRPLLYKVCHPDGAVVRRGVELGSAQERRVLTKHTTIKVTGRIFTESPMDRCIERLQLAGRAGYISVKMNRLPPADELIAECCGEDESFDPSHANDYHTNACKSLKEGASFDDNNNNSSSWSSRQQYSGSSTGAADEYCEKCLICLIENRTSTIVHGETGHIACCLSCARILKARGDRCPVCRLPIDSVIQHFWV